MLTISEHEFQYNLFMLTLSEHKQRYQFLQADLFIIGRFVKIQQLCGFFNITRGDFKFTQAITAFNEILSVFCVYAISRAMSRHIAYRALYKYLHKNSLVQIVPQSERIIQYFFLLVL